VYFTQPDDGFIRTGGWVDAAFEPHFELQPPRKFPRSDAQKDAIMIRRVEARRRLRRLRLLRVAGFSVAIPFAALWLIKAYTLSIQWLLN
jgi:hypothetical protein